VTAPGRAGLLAVAVGAASCAPRVPPPDLSLDPGELLAQVERVRSGVLRVRGEARVHVESESFSGSALHFLAAEKPERLHVETLDFFGNPAVVLVVADGRLGLYDARERVFYRGAASAENLSRIVPVALAPADLVTILCGSAPLVEGSPARAEPGRGVVRLLLESPVLVQTLEVGPGAAVASSRVRDRRGAPVHLAPDLSFSEHRPEGMVPFPEAIRLRSGEPEVEVWLEWREVEVNGDGDGALFRLEPPAGARVVELGEDEAVPSSPPPVLSGPENLPPAGRRH
jgi:hypothetical protein